MQKEEYLNQFLQYQFITDNWFDLMQKSLIFATESNSEYIEELVYRYLHQETQKIKNATKKEYQQAFNIMIKNHVV